MCDNFLLSSLFELIPSLTTTWILQTFVFSLPPWLLLVLSGITFIASPFFLSPSLNNSMSLPYSLSLLLSLSLLVSISFLSHSPTYSYLASHMFLLLSFIQRSQVHPVLWESPVASRNWSSQPEERMFLPCLLRITWRWEIAVEKNIFCLFIHLPCWVSQSVSQTVSQSVT